MRLPLILLVPGAVRADSSHPQHPRHPAPINPLTAARGVARYREARGPSPAAGPEASGAPAKAQDTRTALSDQRATLPAAAPPVPLSAAPAPAAPVSDPALPALPPASRPAAPPSELGRGRCAAGARGSAADRAAPAPDAFFRARGRGGR